MSKEKMFEVSTLPNWLVNSLINGGVLKICRGAI